MYGGFGRWHVEQVRFAGAVPAVILALCLLFKNTQRGSSDKPAMGLTTSRAKTKSESALAGPLYRSQHAPGNQSHRSRRISLKQASASARRTQPPQTSYRVWVYCRVTPSKENPTLFQSKAPNSRWFPIEMSCRPAFRLRLSTPRLRISI